MEASLHAYLTLLPDLVPVVLSYLHETCIAMVNNKQLNWSLWDSPSPVVNAGLWTESKSYVTRCCAGYVLAMDPNSCTLYHATRSNVYEAGTDVHHPKLSKDNGYAYPYPDSSGTGKIVTSSLFKAVITFRAHREHLAFQVAFLNEARQEHLQYQVRCRYHRNDYMTLDFAAAVDNKIFCFTTTPRAVFVLEILNKSTVHRREEFINQIVPRLYPNFREVCLVSPDPVLPLLAILLRRANQGLVVVVNARTERVVTYTTPLPLSDWYDISLNQGLLYFITVKARVCSTNLWFRDKHWVRLRETPLCSTWEPRLAMVK
jgi:hypothetical protein